MKRIAWLSILLLILGAFGGCKRSPDEAEKVAGAATEVVRQEETETVQKEEEMIPPADQPEAEEPPKAGETVEEKEEQITPPETQAPQKPEVEDPSAEPEPQEPSEGKDEPEENEPEENEPEEEIDLNAGNRFSPRKPMEPGYDKYYCDATIDDEFKPGEVYVCLKNEVSYPNKKWPLSTFACVDPASVKNDNYIDDPEVISRINLDTFTQTFIIILKDNTKEAVLKAIRKLEKLDIVFFATPISTVGHSVERTTRTTKDSSSIKETTAFDAQVNYGFNFIGNANGFDATTQTSMPYYPFYDYR